jgi:hypothetical protein
MKVDYKKDLKVVCARKAWGMVNFDGIVIWDRKLYLNSFDVQLVEF